MSIEAMKLALEAICGSGDFLFNWHDCEPNNEREIQAYQAALATNEKAFTALRQAIEQAQKQEPVAWMRKDETCTDCFVWEKTEDHTITLYTSPPQRQPLTDEQISDMIPNRTSGEYSFDEMVALARAIESAHGITGEKE